MKTKSKRILEDLLVSDIKAGKTPDKKVLQRVNGHHIVGHVEYPTVPSMELKMDNWEYPRCLHVFENNKEYATIEIPRSTQNEINILSGDLSESQKRNALTILNGIIAGSRGWESVWFFFDYVAPQLEVE